MRERKAKSINGYVGLIVMIAISLASAFLIVKEMMRPYRANVGMVAIGVAGILIAFLFMSSLTIVQPNQAKILTFFGKYVGTITNNGLHMTVPLTNKRNVSMKIRNFSTKILKVNDVDGNPIDIAGVIAFKVEDSYKAVFDVDYYEVFVEKQSETALRHVATKYPYDADEEGEISLRGNVEEISEELEVELTKRLEVAGVKVIDARLSNLSYAEEIAGAMLQKQQAKAILSARKLIVEGAVSMTKSAIEQIEIDQNMTIDAASKLQLINNLLVSIISDRGATPTISLDATDTNK